MRLHYITKEDEYKYENFSNVICLERVSSSEFLMRFIDPMDQIIVKALKVDKKHMITIEEV